MVRAPVGHEPLLRCADGRRDHAGQGRPLPDRRTHRSRTRVPARRGAARGAVLALPQLHGAALSVDRLASAPVHRPVRRLRVYVVSAGSAASVERAWQPGHGRGPSAPARKPRRLLRVDDGDGRRDSPGLAPDRRHGAHRKHAGHLHERQRHELRASRHLGQGQRHASPEHVRHLGEGTLPHRAARTHRAGGAQRVVERLRCLPDAARLPRHRGYADPAAPGPQLPPAARGRRVGAGTRHRGLRRIRPGTHGAHARLEVRAPLPRWPARAVRPRP